MIIAEKILIIPSNINIIIDAYKEKLPDLESGGIILGKILPNKHILIEALTHPNKKDKRGLYFFHRDRNEAQKIINQKWEESNGEIIYLGEWHTHNEDIPIPSKRDLTMIKNQLRTSKMEIDFLLLLIIGQKENYYGIETKLGHNKIKTSNNPFCYYINI
ncbi:Mov34/MPN/PAD-1 family protein [bacterium]|nr:Mov34/MPN/PAD-1 family protein [bacterium]